MGEKEDIDEYEAELEAEIENNLAKDRGAIGLQKRVGKGLDKAGFLLY